MASVKMKGNPVELYGELPEVGEIAPAFSLTKSDLQDISLSDFAGKNLILNIFPSIDTAVCAMSVRKFNIEADKLKDTLVLAISHDLPFALQRYCAAEGLNNIVPLSAFRNPEFGKGFGLLIETGALKGLLTRAVFVLDQAGKIIYSQLVPDIGQEPDYAAVLKLFS